MWYFRSPEICFGEDSLSRLEQIQGRRAFIITDPVIEQLGLVARVRTHLEKAGLETSVFADVEPDASLETVWRCARELAAFAPDWIVGLGGGSSMDAAKAAWLFWAQPDIDPEWVNPLDEYQLRQKARLITIPTTAGSGSEISQAALVKDVVGRRKITLASWEFVPDLAIIDPCMTITMPGAVTADTGVDALTHAVEAVNNAWSNDFTAGLCLQAASLVFTYLPQVVADGQNLVGREKMANAAALGGLTILNTNVSLAHALGHSAGALFNLPHGRVTGLMLAPSVEFIARGGNSHYQQMAALLGLPASDEMQAAFNLAAAIRGLLHQIGQPVSLQEANILPDVFASELDNLCQRAETDLGMAMSPRQPDRRELRQLFEYAYDGKVIDF